MQACYCDLFLAGKYSSYVYLLSTVIFNQLAKLTRKDLKCWRGIDHALSRIDAVFDSRLYM